MKYVSILFFNLCLLNSFSANEQKNCIDTAVVLLKKHKDYSPQLLARNFLSSYYFRDTLFYDPSKKIKKKAQPTNKAYGTVFDVCRNKSYFIIRTNKGKPIAEGYWLIEYFSGQYKEFYKNGNLKFEGFYLGDLKIKNWKYYNESGKLIKEEVHDEKGNVTSTKNYE